MFVPVITKDMQLFPGGGRQALPPRHAIKNVRSRAQCLEEYARQSVAANRKSGHNVSASTASVAIARQRVLPTVPARQHSSQSVGSLLANGARSPPNRNGSMRKPELDAIAEGVEMTSSVGTRKSDSPSSQVSPTSTPDLQELRIRPPMKLSTSSSPGLERNWNSPSDRPTIPPDADVVADGIKNKKSFVKWIRNTLNANNGGEKQKDELICNGDRWEGRDDRLCENSRS